ncbi:putative Fumarate reductase/succinate dehydrogenase flavoprotein [Bradyrhizobium sp. ORS 285]|uniref:FAD-dependent oxidoreductase n=1 Tax=Bradyrhizobium sp. ORS 285 TaxID=115808 RepID=UPI0002409A82|nr:FAD-dependent oxidoreductase [Bradyrhizobium sp. ORS 285]CCD86964.1 putative Fumarate reductase/succinate dehydrogenase flavoprotein [Bradyrhizobium sp. ORS 285]SMX56904.1 putative Fumarate reductase/succinate dehydrogenase flavoprotein [Bradyrhizobium sp. ORS 285]
MSTIEIIDHTPEFAVDCLIIGAGAAGLVAALSAIENGESVLVLERDAVPQGSTALSAGLVPAAGTRWQTALGIDDTPSRFADDIMHKAHDEPDAVLVKLVTTTIGPTLEWLADRHQLPLSLVDNFTYPGHSRYRMHGLPSRAGRELIDRLRTAAEAAGIDILCDAHATTLLLDADRRIIGVRFMRPDGSSDEIGCRRLILACSGYGGNPALVARHIPQMASATYFGHVGNQGDALNWGEQLGAATRHLGGHQGHGSVAHPAGILISWATITEGGFQVNARGERFSNEASGYSEQAANVLAQPDGVAWTIFDARIAGIAAQFEDFRNAVEHGAVLEAEDIVGLVAAMRVPFEALAATFAEVATAKSERHVDRFGRSFAGVPQLAPAYRAVKVTGALFHTQGGLLIDDHARVMRKDRTSIDNLFAAGGAACGVSGADASGYLSGNGLLTAVALGRVAGLAR